MRIIGKVATFVQYVKDGTPMGQYYFSATVVRGLTNCLDVEAIAGTKLVSHLTGSPVDVKETPSPKRKKTRTSPKKDSAERKREDAALCVPAAVPGVEAVNKPEVSHVDQSISTSHHSSEAE